MLGTVSSIGGCHARTALGFGPRPATAGPCLLSPSGMRDRIVWMEAFEWARRVGWLPAMETSRRSGGTCTYVWVTPREKQYSTSRVAQESERPLSCLGSPAWS